MNQAQERWHRLDPDGPSEIVWVRAAAGERVAVLLGAFDPPTGAHLEILDAAADAVDAAPALCLTKVLLARGTDQLLEPEARVGLLHSVAERIDVGLALANRGRYLDVGRAFRASGAEPIFIVGSDKLLQLADPSFYDDGAAGVADTFKECVFIVVPREGSPVVREDVRVLPTADVFGDPALAEVSATQVRRLVRSGEPFDHLVPPEVGLAVRGYTSPR